MCVLKSQSSMSSLVYLTPLLIHVKVLNVLDTSILWFFHHLSTTEFWETNRFPKPLHDWASAGTSTRLRLKHTEQRLAWKSCSNTTCTHWPRFPQNSTSPMLRHAVRYRAHFQPLTLPCPNTPQGQNGRPPLHWSRKSLPMILKDRIKQGTLKKPVWKI